MSKTAWLILDDGTKFEGQVFGSACPAGSEITGEVVFSTGMTGFQETLTDPNYRGQIVVQTFPLIGNTGANEEDNESEFSPIGYIVKEYCDEPSNFRARNTLDAFMRHRGVVGLHGIDTRKLTHVLRDKGTVKGVISTDPNAELAPLDVLKITTPNTERVIADPKYNIGFVDLGARNSLVKLLNKYGCSLTTLNNDYDAIIISDGAGNPENYPIQIESIKRLLEFNKPVLAIGLGHQLLAAAAGCKTYKLKCGHRGDNQPVRDLRDGNIYITRQNHGNAVDSKSVTKNIGEIFLENVNDKSCEGILYKNLPAMSIQFDPTENGGIRKTTYLIEEFLGGLVQKGMV
jgi:carbamoyl-phosphate synthase small subunit